MNNTDIDLFELSATSDEGELMQVCNPATGEPLFDDEKVAVGMSLVGRDSKEYRNAQRAVTNRRLSNKSGTTLTAERLESEANEVLAKCVKSWSGIVFEGEAINCDYQNAKMIFDRVPWIKEQVDEFVADRSNFLG